MKNVSITSRIGIFALLIGLFSTTFLFANGTSGESIEEVKSKDEIAAEKLESTVFVDEVLMEFEVDLTAEGILSCSKDIIVKILNEADEVIYEGAYNGIAAADKILKKYMSRGDLIVNVGNVAYYMVF
ncbi:MAG: hypothetical protein ACI9L9_002548 [Marivirga sp.]|jgi:hypothetical protein